MIAQQTLDEVFAVRISEAVEKRGTPLEKAGKEMVACCPLHSETSPSFKVNDNKGIFKCFGCGKGGNVVNFYMEKESLSYPEAIKLIANDFNIDVLEDDKPEDAEAIAESQRLDNLVLLNERALEIWSKFATPENAIRHPNASDFEVVYAPDSWDTLKKEMKDVSIGSLHEIGLLGHKEETDHYYDFWSNRLIFPIRDHRGRLVGFGGESMLPTPEEKKKVGKYINTKSTPLFNKSAVLFGLGANDARTELRKTGKAHIVEGYWDVVANHRIGRINTAATCGTALTADHVKLLKRMGAKCLVLTFDGDDAGMAAAFKAIPLVILNGLDCQVCIIPDGKDPDDLVNDVDFNHDQNWQAAIKTFDSCTEDAIEWYAKNLFDDTATPSEQSDQIDQIAFLIGLLKDGNVQLLYGKRLAKIIPLTPTEWKKRVQTASRAIDREKPENTTALNFKGKNYDAPHGINLHDYSHDICEYGLFMHKNIIYMQRNKKSKDDEDGSETTYYFKPVSNFSIRIIQHMDDLNDPKQLVQICNIHGRKRTFETSTDSFVNEGSFNKMLSKHGNFRWRGVNQDFNYLDAKLKEEMGDGRMISVLGWQPEGFWAFSNRIILKDGSVVMLEKYGQATIDNVSYYIASGNDIYKKNNTIHGPQKKAIWQDCELSLEEYWALVNEVFGAQIYNGILFSIATTFTDVVCRVINSFPLLFLYGPPGTGKDEMIRAITAIHGKKQAAVDMTGESSGKGAIRHTAQFANMVAHLSEYRLGVKLEALLMSLFDRNGYSRAERDYSFNNNEVPINSTIVVTSNYYPTDGPTISRLLSEELVKGSYTEKQSKRFDYMKEVIEKGVSSLLPNIIKHRELFEKGFRKKVNEEKASLKREFKSKAMASEDQERMIQNAAILGATYRLLEKQLPFPFTYDEWKQNIFKGYEKQMSKMLSGSVLSQFWNGVLAAIRDERNPLIMNHDYKLSGDELLMHFASCYSGYAARVKGGFAESDNKIKDELKRHKAFMKTANSAWFSSERRSSGYIFNVNDIGPDFKDDLLQAITVAEINAARRNGHSAPEPSYDDKKAAAKQTEAPY